MKLRILLLSFFFSSYLFAIEGKTVFSMNNQQEGLSLSEINESPSIALPTEKYETSIFKVFLSLFGLILLIILSFWLFRRLLQARSSSSGANRSISILEKRVLSPKSMLYLLEVDGKKVLIAESHLEIKRLHSWEEPAELTE